MSLRSIFLLAMVFAEQALSYGILGEFIIDGMHHAGFPTSSIYRIRNGNPAPDTAAWSTDAVNRDYIDPDSMSTLDIICHKSAVPSALTATVAAGSTVDFFWPDWPHNTGPVLTYIAPCDGNCAVADKAALRWVKIEEAGYDGTWAAEKLMNNNFTWTTTVPATIAADNYVFRHEIINLHPADQPNGAQLYPQCVNIEITGSGTDAPVGVLGVELYRADDVGILVDPYVDNLAYELPGPALYVPGALVVPGANISTTESVAAAPIAAPKTLFTSARRPLDSRTRSFGTRTKTLGSKTRSLVTTRATGFTVPHV